MKLTRTHIALAVVGTIALAATVTGITVAADTGNAPAPAATSSKAPAAELPADPRIRSYLMEADRTYGDGKVCADVADLGVEQAATNLTLGFAVHTGGYVTPGQMRDELVRYCDVGDRS